MAKGFLLIFFADIFNNFFHCYLTIADISLATNTDILKLAFRYIYRYFESILVKVV